MACCGVPLMDGDGDDNVPAETVSVFALDRVVALRLKGDAATALGVANVDVPVSSVQLHSGWLTAEYVAGDGARTRYLLPADAVAYARQELPAAVQSIAPVQTPVVTSPQPDPE